MRRILPLLALLALALAPASAHAGWFGSERVDGPAPISGVAVDLAREVGGGLVYVKSGAGWVSRLRNGAWATPEAFSGPGTTEVGVAAGEDGRLALAAIVGGRVFAATNKTGGVAVSPPGASASNLVLDIGVNGVAYAVWEQGGDVRAAQLKDETWRAVPAPLDIDPARSAGTGTSRPRVAVAADGSALVVWGERLPDGTHVFARRLYGTALSALPRDAGAGADLPDVDTEWDRSYAWVVFRQTVGGVQRGVARRLRASTFEPPQYIDAGAANGEPRVSMSGLGRGVAATSTAAGAVVGAQLKDDVFSPASGLGSGAGAVVAFSDRYDAAVAWRSAGGVQGRIAREGGRFQRAVPLATPAFGAVPSGELDAASNRVGDVAVAMVQGAHVTVAMHDISPSRPVFSGTRSTGPRRPKIDWNAGQDFLGRQTYRVMVDGREVATTRKTKLRAPRLKPGRRRLQIIAVDRRGQEMASRSWVMRIKRRGSRRRARATADVAREVAGNRTRRRSVTVPV